MNDLIKELREITGAGIMDIQEALQEGNNDKEKAIEILRKKGSLKLGKKADRAAKEGIVEAYIHPGGKMGVLLEINCETDFVARTDDFKNLAKELALHIAASAPLYISATEVPEATLLKERTIYLEQAKDKPEDVANKMVEGKVAKYFEETCLLEQNFVKDPNLKVKDVVAGAVAKMGENVVVKRFARFVLGN